MYRSLLTTRLTLSPDYCRLLSWSRCRQVRLRDHPRLRPDALDQFGRGSEHVYHHHDGLPGHLCRGLSTHSLRKEVETAVC